MKKLLLLLIALIFLAVSCSSSKKAENDDNAVLPDEDITDIDENDEDAESSGNDEDAAENPCEKMANSTGEYFEYYDYDNGAEKKYKCTCLEDSFQLKPGCRKISYANICTEVKKCYSAWEEIECREEGKEFYGQDIQYAKLGYCIKKDFSRYNTVRDEPTYFDNNLKIEWTDKISDKTYNWYDAMGYCRNLKYGGYDDWRVPLPQELLLAYNTFKMSNQSGISLWSDQLLAKEDDSYAWTIDPRTMKLSYARKMEENNVRCVRGKPIDVASSFKPVDTYLTVDYKNGLMWSTANFTRDKMWNEALTECENSTAAGFSDWRLPNIHELATLLNFEKDGPASDFPYPEDIPVYFWSSTTLTSNIGESPGVTIYRSGEIKNLYKGGVIDNEHNFNRVVCVRNELCRENYFWNGEKCVESPCSGNPCEKDEHSDGLCHFENVSTYSCGCVENYFWNGVKCVNPCDTDPCKYIEHSNKKCKPRDDWRYTCGCEEGFWWWGQNKGCIERKPDLAHICTGQTKCYDNEKEIECPAKGEEFYGQDAQYADLGYCAPPNYTVERKVENEPVVIDNYTGLSWQQKVYVPETYIGWKTYLNYCENSNYGGYDDWRMPGVWEYKSIMDFGRYHPNVDPEYFPDTPPEYFVTSVYYRYDCGEPHYPVPATWVYLVNFDHFDTFLREGCANDPPFNLPVRCVRGKAEGTSLSKIAYSYDVTVSIDKKFNILMTSWDFYAPSQKWADALDYCENLTYAGLSGWRLMNIREIHLFSGGQPSTSEAYDPTKAMGPIWKEITFEDVRCIRDNPCKSDEVWFESKCMKNPCVNNPCGKKTNSDGACQPINEELYSCRCDDFYYYWNAESMKCVESCKKGPCKYIEHSDQQCYEDDPKGYRCGCDEGYTWDFDSKKCLDDNETGDDDSGNQETDNDSNPDTDTIETPNEISDADSTETPDIDADNDAVSDTDIAEVADETPDSDGI